MAYLCIRQASGPRCLAHGSRIGLRNASSASSSSMPTKLQEHTLMVRPLDGFKSMPFVFATLRELESRFGEITHVDIPLADVSRPAYASFGFVSFKDRLPIEKGNLPSDLKQIQVKTADLPSAQRGGPGLQDIAPLLQRKNKVSSTQWRQVMDKVQSGATSTVALELSTRSIQPKQPKLTSEKVRAVCKALGNFSGFANPPTKEMLAIQSKWADRAARSGIALSERQVDALAEYLEEGQEIVDEPTELVSASSSSEVVNEIVEILEDTPPPTGVKEPNIDVTPTPTPAPTTTATPSMPSEGSPIPEDTAKRPSRREVMLQKAKNAAFLAEQQRAATESTERPKVEEADETVILEEATEKNVGQETTTEKKRFWLF